jgi:hypothetical protein
MPDLDERIRRLIDSGTPATLDQIIVRSSPTLTTRRRRANWAQLASAVVAAAVIAGILVAVTSIGPHPASKLRVTQAAQPTSSTAPLPVTVGTTSPPLTGCVLLDQHTDTSTPTYQAGDYWQCTVTAQQAQAVTGSSVPDPTVPDGYLPSYAPFIFVSPGPISAAVYERTWTPGGVFTGHGATGPYIELRLRAHRPGGWGQPTSIQVKLANGVEANASGALETNAAAPTDNNLTWTSDNLDYELEAAGMTAGDILAAANSLP